MHAEQKINFVHTKLIPDIPYYLTFEIIDFADRGKFASIVARVNGHLIQDNKKVLAFYSESNSFIRDLGGFGFKGKYQSKMATFPNSKPQ